MTQTTTITKKKINFVRTDSHKKKRLGDKWRRPRGIQNKRRLRKRSYAPVVKKGYQSAKITRGQTRKGLLPILIKTLSQLENIDKKSQSIIISAKLGNKKRLEALEQATKLGLIVENLNAENKIKSIKEVIEKKKKVKEQTKKEKEEKEKAAKDKAKKEEKKAEDKAKEDAKKIESENEEDAKDKEKKELDKVLTKKQ